MVNLTLRYCTLVADHSSSVSANAACHTLQKSKVECTSAVVRMRRWAGEEMEISEAAAFDLAQLDNVKSSIFILAPFFQGRKYQIRRRPTSAAKKMEKKELLRSAGTKKA